MPRRLLAVARNMVWKQEGKKLFAPVRFALEIMFEFHLRQVEWNAKVVVDKIRILLRIQHLQEGGRGVTVDAGRLRGGESKCKIDIMQKSAQIDITILSTSSSKKTGLFSPTVLKPWMIFPGMEPMYVLLWPRISDWSDTPPREILRKKFEIFLQE